MLPQVPSTTQPITLTALISNSRTFTSLPTHENLISTIVARSSDSAEAGAQILDDALKTRIIIHQRVVQLIENFLRVKIEFGSVIERDLYSNMTTKEFVQRLVLKRPLSFMGPNDETIARDGQPVRGASRKWRLVGTEHQKEPLLLQDYLSYDEIAIAALLGVSSPTYFINSGARANMAKIAAKGEYTERGVYVGLVGARFEVPDQMESRFLIESKLWSAQRGYGLHDPPSNHDQAILRMWAEFYGAKDPETGIFGFPIHQQARRPVLNINLYKRRIGLTLETFLLECEGRGEDTWRKVHAFVVGLGLGVWQYSQEQKPAYLEALIEAIEKISLLYVEVVEVSWVATTFDGVDRKIVRCRDGNEVTVVLTNNDPAARREEDRMLVACYAWDGNSFPGNEIWRGRMTASGDPAAVCCSTIGELQNPYVNPFHENIHVVGH